LLHRTLLWLSVVSLPLLGMAWVLAVLSVSERLPLLSYLLSVAVLTHAVFALIGYCFFNTRVRRNLYVSMLRCIGKKVPLDSSEVTTGGTSSHSHQGATASHQHSVSKIIFLYISLLSVQKVNFMYDVSSFSACAFMSLKILLW
jgi:cadherin EGF LAG seven-pass G-type receptor 1